MGRLASLVFAGILTLLMTSCMAEVREVSKPNILFILTDDQEPSTLEYMDKVQARLIEQGLTFENTVNTFPVCCPSRAVIQRGQYPHNTGVLGNKWPKGGFRRFEANGLKQSTLGTWLDGAGYESAYFGKYMNELGPHETVPGWDRPYIWSEKDRYTWRIAGTNKTIPKKQGDNDLAGKAGAFLGEEHEEPFFVVVSFHSPHNPYYHPKRTDKLFREVAAPRTPDLNEADVSDKPAYVRKRASLGSRGMHQTDAVYRDALRSLEVVDSFVEKAVDILQATGEVENTYIFFYTDNGVHTGFHRLPYSKGSPYERDIAFPLIVRGPGIEAGSTSSELVGNHDIAPTIADLAGAQAPEFVDGRSIASLMRQEDTPWRDAILIQGGGGKVEMPRWYGIRTADETYVEYDNGERELYNLTEDPYELKSIHESADPTLLANLRARLEELKDCSGQRCREAENGP